MRKSNVIAPKRRLIKKAVVSLRLLLWLKAVVACSHHDSDLKKEIKDWPEGFSIFFKVFKDKPCLGIQKRQGTLHMISSPLSFCDDILFTFHSLDIADALFSGKLRMCQAFVEKRYCITGCSTLFFSVIRAVRITENVLFRSRPDHKRVGINISRMAMRFVIFLEIFKIKLEGKEVSSHDSEVLRVS